VRLDELFSNFLVEGERFWNLFCCLKQRRRSSSLRAPMVVVTSEHLDVVGSERSTLRSPRIIGCLFRNDQSVESNSEVWYIFKMGGG
jgi:hypothetical protein